MGQRNIQYVKRNGLNGLKGSLDIPVGREFDLTVGKGVSFLSTNDMQNEKDLFFSLRGYGAIAPGELILTSSFNLQGRKIADSPQSGWNDPGSPRLLLVIPYLPESQGLVGGKPLHHFN